MEMFLFLKNVQVVVVFALVDLRGGGGANLDVAGNLMY